MESSSQHGHGVIGRAEGEGAAGVVGTSQLGTGVLGTAQEFAEPAVLGEHEAEGTGVLGKTHGSALGTAAVKGISSADAAAVIGDSAQGTGVIGQQGGASGAILPTAGVIGASNNHAGVFGYGEPGVVGFGQDDKGAVQAIGGLGSLQAGPTGHPAGAFVGTVTVLGDLKVAGGAKQFLMDHPLDPENRYLQHAAVEAPALKTFYDGTVTLDESGQARVVLPDWFGSINADLCYSLTPVGAPAPDLHISQEYDGAAFRIGGGRAEMRVCWQVTGVRKDRSALAHPLVVEQEKEPENIGRYADPVASDGERGPFLAWATELLTLRSSLTERLRTDPDRS
ncbi:hypothetical protein ACFQ7J_07500 [Streptomyces sp. NPDC056501]|uniref:hypothetical protein n=1 Tax=Streptomyces sp. NPDC056501 TaxID=3345841 RepID=UPI00367FF75E